MIHDEDTARNLDTDEVLLLLDDWDSEDGMDMPSTILILQRKWRPYQVKKRKNTSRQWIMKSKVLREGTHSRLF